MKRERDPFYVVSHELMCVSTRYKSTINKSVDTDIECLYHTYRPKEHYYLFT